MDVTKCNNGLAYIFSPSKDIFPPHQIRKDKKLQAQHYISDKFGANSSTTLFLLIQKRETLSMKTATHTNQATHQAHI